MNQETGWKKRFYDKFVKPRYLDFLMFENHMPIKDELEKFIENEIIRARAEKRIKRLPKLLF